MALSDHTMSGRWGTLLFIILSAVALLVCALPAAASATPISQKKAQLQQIRNQVAALDHSLEAVIEKYNYANQKLATVQHQIKTNSRELKVARYNLAVARRNLSARVVALYKRQQADVFDVVFSTSSFQDLITQVDYMNKLGQQDSDILTSVRQYKQQVQLKRVSLIADQKTANNLLSQVTAKKRSIEQTLNQRKSMLAGVASDIRRLERQEAAAAARRVAAVTNNGTTTDPSTPAQNPIIPEAGGPGHPEVCGIAARYLGVKYVYGGASPETGFDCSGFVMYVYAQIGIGLPHYSGSQQSMGTPVSMSALQPGDLVFRGNPAYHVGIYVGGGMVIHSPHTGAVVSYQSVSGWESAVRL